MTAAIQRKVTIDKHGKPVISNLRVPFERGDVVWVQTSADTVVVTVSEPVKEEPEKVAIPKPPHRCPSCNNDSLETLHLDLQQYTFFCQKCGQGGPLFMTRGGL